MKYTFSGGETGQTPQIPYMIDQSHMISRRIEAMIQNGGHRPGVVCQSRRSRITRSSRVTQGTQTRTGGRRGMPQEAFFADVRPAIIEWRKQHNLPLDPLGAFRQSGYEARVATERKARRIELGISGSGSYA